MIIFCFITLMVVKLVSCTLHDCVYFYRESLTLGIDCLIKSANPNDAYEILKYAGIRFPTYNFYARSCDIVLEHFDLNECLHPDNKIAFLCHLSDLYNRNSVYVHAPDCHSELPYDNSSYRKEVKQLAQYKHNAIRDIYNNHTQILTSISGSLYELLKHRSIPYSDEFFKNNANFSTSFAKFSHNDFRKTINNITEQLIKGGDRLDELIHRVNHSDITYTLKLLVNNINKSASFQKLFFDKFHTTPITIGSFQNLIDVLNKSSNSEILKVFTSYSDHQNKFFDDFLNRTVTKDQFDSLIHVSNNTKFWEALILGNHTTNLKGIFGGLVDGIGDVFKSVFISVVDPILNSIFKFLEDRLLFTVDEFLDIFDKLFAFLSDVLSKLFKKLNNKFFVVETIVITTPLALYIRDFYTSSFIFCTLLIVLGLR